MVFKEETVQNQQLPSRCPKNIRTIRKNAFKFLSVLMLPFVVGIFTIIITIHQQNIAREQRLEDLQLARLQRLEDRNESRLQRELDWEIATMQRQAENKAVNDQYQDEILLNYIKEIGDLLKENNGPLTSNSLTNTLARAKTLNIIRQLDGPRQIHVIRFLYETGQLTNTNKSVPLDISTAKLIGIDFRELTLTMTFENISFAGVYLRNCTFNDIKLKNVVFSSAQLYNVNFSSTELMENVSFSSASLTYVSFLPNKRLNNVDFSSANLNHVNFSATWLKNINFLDTSLTNIIFSSAQFSNVSFSSVKWLSNVTFSSAWLSIVNFSSTDFKNVNFSSAWLSTVDFTSAQFEKSYSNTFHHADLIDATFMRCLCQEVDFSYTNLKGSSFYSAALNNANFTFANLQKVDFTNTIITDSQLQSALSIRNAKLPNGTLGRDHNLIQNGDANCNIPLVSHWQVQNGNIAVMVSKESQNECQFSLQSLATGAMMYQRINLVPIWDSSFWKDSRVELQAHMSSGVSIELSGKARNRTVVNKEVTNSIQNKIIMQLEEDMVELEIVVKFNAHDNKSNKETVWCDNIELYMDYDTHALICIGCETA